MKNLIIIIALCLLVIVSGAFILTSNTSDSTGSTQSTSTNSISTNNSNESNSTQIEEINIEKTKLDSFNELKGQSDLIIEATGTNIYEEKKTNYIAYELCSIDVNEVIKGNYTSTDIKVLLDIDVDPLLENNQKYLLFLKKMTTTNGEYYTPLGYGQGIYKIIEDSSNTSSSSSTPDSSISNSNINNSESTLESNSSTNIIFDELTSNYETVKLNCQ